jgi:putative hydrolase of the HAD superfamily
MAIPPLERRVIVSLARAVAKAARAAPAMLLPVIDVILFDLGGVLIDVRDGPALAALDGTGIDAAQAQARWRASTAREAFESGSIDAATFAQRFLEEWPLPVSPAALLARMGTWIFDAYPGVPQLLEHLRGRYRLGCVSNTSALHWQRMCSVADLDSCLECAFLSFEIGACKPAPELFERVTRELGVSASRIFFLDDVQLNVDAARRHGWRAQRAVSAAGAERALREAGLW